MTIRRAPLAALVLGTMTLAACAAAGSSATVEQASLTPLPTVEGVGVLPAAVPTERKPLVVITRPVNDDGTAAALVGDTADGNRLLMIGDSILASTATRYSGYMCDELVPLGWAVEVDAEASRFVDFGNRVLDKRLDPERGDEYDWDAAAVFLGSNYGSDQDVYEAELRTILTRLAPRPTLLYTVTEYRPNWAEVNDVVRDLAAEFDNVTVVDWQQLATTPGVLSSDRLHPTDGGRRLLVDLTAASLGPATVGAGECLRSAYTDDSAVGSAGAGSPASNPSAGRGSSGRAAPATTVSTVRPGGSTGAATTVVPVSTVSGSPSTAPPSASAPTTVPSATPSTVPPTVATTAAPNPPNPTTAPTTPTSPTTPPTPPTTPGGQPTAPP